MTPRTFAAIAETVADRWQACFDDQFPSDVWGMSADVVAFEFWLVNWAGLPELSWQERAKLYGAVCDRVFRLRRARAMVEAETWPC